MNWKEYINDLALSDRLTSFAFEEPATKAAVDKLKAEFKLYELPDELVDLYAQTDGIAELLNGIEIGELIWPAQRVLEINKEYRSLPEFKELYMSFEQLLFLADAGNGDLFGCVALNGRFDRRDIFVWNHEDDSRTWVAPDLTTFIKWWSEGRLKV